MGRDAYEPKTPQAKEQRAWQLERQGATRAGIELRREAQQQRMRDDPRSR